MLPNLFISDFYKVNMKTWFGISKLEVKILTFATPKIDIIKCLKQLKTKKILG